MFNYNICGTLPHGPQMIVLLSILLMGCAFEWDPGQIPCNSDLECPSGYFCISNSGGIGACSVTQGPVEGDDVGECSDGVDNNQDGRTDCDDPGCSNDAACEGDDDDSAADDDDSAVGDDDIGDDDDDTTLDDDDITMVDGDGDGVPASGDCDDLDPLNFPGNTEVCDGQDNDCNGLDDAGSVGVGGQEVDGDGDGVWPCQGDCDDSDPLRSPALNESSPESCIDGIDNDCDLVTDEEDPGCPACLSTATAQGMGFVHICGDTFDMGCTPGDAQCQFQEFPVHTVTLTHDFELSRAEVTQGQWQGLMGNNPSYFSPSGGGTDCGLDCPVEHVNWWESLAFANAMSAAGGLSECYTLSGCDANAPGTGMACSGVTINSPSGSVYDCEGYRLPTEAEWEYAARGGEDLLYSGSDTLDDVGWYRSNSGETTHPVALKQANAFGLYDMSGNVSEWTNDWYGISYYFSSPNVDPIGPSTGPGKTYRGGGFGTSLQGPRTGSRYSYPVEASYWIGARLARTLPL